MLAVKQMSPNTSANSSVSLEGVFPLERAPARQEGMGRRGC